MSNITDILFSAQGGQLIDNLAARFGLTNEQMDAAVQALVPALSIGLGNAAEEANSLEKIIGAANAPQRLAAFDDPDAAQSDDNLEQGRELLAQLFGSSSAAGRVAQVAARESGLRPDILSQLLPVLASVVLGGLFKNFNNQGLGGILGQLAGSGALGSILGQALGGGQQAPAPAPIPQSGGGGLGGGGLGGLLGGLLGALLGGRRAPSDGAPSDGAPRGGGVGGGAPDGFNQDGGAGAGGLPPGLDQESLQAALEQIKKTLQPGAGAANAGQHSELQDILGQVFGQRGR
jgi:hypothetical protein